MAVSAIGVATPGASSAMAYFLSCGRLAAIAEVRPGAPVEIGLDQVGADRRQDVDRLLAVVGRGDDQAGHMVEMGVADQVALDRAGEHVADAALRGIGRHGDAGEGALLLGHAQAVHQGAGIAGHAAVVAMGMDQRGAEVAVLDAAQRAQHHQVEAVGGESLRARRAATPPRRWRQRQVLRISSRLPRQRLNEPRLAFPRAAAYPRSRARRDRRAADAARQIAEIHAGAVEQEMRADAC